MEELIARIVHAHPALKKQVAGASAEEIAELEQLTGASLPAGYRAFLAFMGRSAGPFAPVRTTRVHAATGDHEQSEPIDTSIDVVLRRYRKRARKEKDGKRSSRVHEPAGAVFLGRTAEAQDLGWFFVDLREPALPVAEHDSTGEKWRDLGPLGAFVFGRHFPALVE